MSYITEARLGVIFDVDGVLLDSYQMHFECWLAVAAEDGIVITEPDFRSLFGRRGQEIARQVWGPELTELQVVSIHRRKQALYRESLQRNLPAMDGAVQLIDGLLEAGLVLAVGSSAPFANVEMTLEGLGRKQVFSAIVTGSDVTQGKPDPRVFLLAAQRMGLEPSHCAVIEDAPAGIAAAVTGGMTAIALLGTAPADRFPQAHLVIDSLHQLSPKRIADLIQAQN
ncbi:MAG: HAD family phosphatase [Syntrophobacterales bacterium]|jgi:beta-phosphoglucomutase